MAGWIKIHRDLANHWIAQDMEKLGRWLDLLMFASHKENKVLMGGKLVEVKRGQMIASCDFLAKRWKCSKSTVSTFLDLLESDGMIERCTERKITHLTICNYESYQQADNEDANDIPNDSRTIAERCPNELKNVKNVEEINNNLSSAHAREENAPWEEARERGFAESFKGYGAALPLSKVVGKTPVEVMTLLEVYMAHRQLTGLGHKDYRHFVEAFKQAIKNNKIYMPAKEEAKQSRVVTGADVLKLYG